MAQALLESAQLRELGFKNIKLLRGNVARRVLQITIGEYDAIVLAYAGLIRLKIKSLADDVFSVDQSPSSGQGVMVLSVYLRKDLIKLFKKMDNLVVKREVSLERKITAVLGGLPQPIACLQNYCQQKINIKKKR